MRTNLRQRPKLSTKQKIIVYAGAFCFLAIGFIVFINLTDRREARATVNNLFSRGNGAWGNTSVWSYTNGGASCNCFPASSDNVTINHIITMDRNLTNQGSNQNGITGILTINAGATLTGGTTYDIDIRSAGTLNLCGTLIANNTTFSNGSYVYVCPTGVLTINGNLDNKNNSANVIIDGTVTVGGSLTNETGSTISGSGTITVNNGPLSNSGTIMGCTGNSCPVFPCGYPQGCGTLPITLVGFDAKPSGKVVNLTWMTANEINNNYFTVERSDEGSKFLPLKNMNGAGNSTAMLHYKYTDEKPLAGANCYRIKQTDYDGHFTYSPIKKVRLDKILSNQEITMESIGPNPFTESFLLNYSTISDGKVNLTLINSTGGIVKQETLNVVKGNNSYQFIDNTNIAPGIYYLTLAMNDKVVTKKIIKN